MATRKDGQQVIEAPVEGTTLPAVPVWVESVASVTRLLEKAIDKGVDVAAMEKLVLLRERMEDRAAAQEFAEALAAFQGQTLSIHKSRTATIASDKGKFSYKYAALEDVAKAVRPVLHGLGFSYSWDIEAAERMLKVTCTLRHVNGHATTSSFTAPTESRAGMSEVQKFGSAASYAKRQTLIDVLGLTTCDEAQGDDIPPGGLDRISDSQAADLTAALEEIGTDPRRFLKVYGVAKVEDLPKVNFAAACALIEEKRRKA